MIKNIKKNSKNLKFLNIKKKPNKVKKTIKPIPYGKHHIDKSDIDALVQVLKTGPITQGLKVDEFEKKFSSFVGAKYAVAVSSCTAGLHISSVAANLKKSDYFMTSAISFVSSANAGSYCQANVIFADVEKNTVNISKKTIQEAININKIKKLKILVPVHMAGAPCNLSEIIKLKKKYQFEIIEDAAHALGAKYECGSMVGSCKYSLATVFSLHPVKSITSGEGGIITTNNFRFYKKLLRLRSHGITKDPKIFINKLLSKTEGSLNSWYSEMQDLGFHYRITDFQCALAISQLKKLKAFIKKRRLLAKRYDLAFKNSTNISLIQQDYRKISSHHLYVISVNFKKMKINKAKFVKELMKKNIITQVHYMPIFLHPFYANKKNYNSKQYTNSLQYYENSLSIPIFFDLTANQQKYVINCLKEILN